MEPHQEAKLDAILKGLSRLEPQVAESRSDVRFLRSEIVRVQVQQAKESERLNGLEDDFNGLGAKVREHVKDKDVHAPKEDAWSGATVRWKFVGAVAAAVSGLLILAGMIATYTPK